MGSELRLLEDLRELSHYHSFCRKKIQEAVREQRLCICFGAGLSIGATKCGWIDLVKRCLEAVGSSRLTDDPSFMAVTEDTERFKGIAGDSYLDIVRGVLYEDDVSYDASLQNQKAILEFLRRARMRFQAVIPTVCLNFDSFAEDYFAFRDERATPVVDVEERSTGFEVMHPHGSLPKNGSGSDWLVFSKEEYASRKEGRMDTDALWNAQLLNVFHRSYTIVYGIGGSTDVWQFPVAVLQRLKEKRGTQQENGCWLILDSAPPHVSDLIASLGFVPLKFQSFEAMEIFCESLIEA